MGRTLLTAADGVELITLAVVKARLGSPDSDDTLLSAFISGSASAIADELNYEPAYQKYAETLPGLDRRLVLPSAKPIDPDRVTVKVDTVANTAFTLQSPRHAPYLATRWPAGDEELVEVTYWAGYFIPAQNTPVDTAVAVWTIDTVTALGAWRKATKRSLSHWLWECTTVGTTDSTEPVWSGVANGGTIVDGTATWTQRRVLELPDDLYEAAWLSVFNAYDRHGEVPGLKSWAIESMSESYQRGSEDLELSRSAFLPPNVMAVLQRYKS